MSRRDGHELPQIALNIAGRGATTVALGGDAYGLAILVGLGKVAL